MSTLATEQAKLTKARSPNYPAIGLPEAIEKVRAIFDNKDHKHKVPKEVIARHLGYTGLNGASLPVISALLKYGLLEGRGDALQVTDVAVSLLVDQPGSPERTGALQRAAARPALFAELDKAFPGGLPSDAALEAHLIKSGFIRKAAKGAIQAYRETKELVSCELGGYSAGSGDGDDVLLSEKEKPQRSDPRGALSIGSSHAEQEQERLRFTLSGGRGVRLIFNGPPPTQAEIEELLEYLAVSKRTFPP